jgi:5-methylcytosine-specific restriction endonuclease McrA
MAENKWQKAYRLSHLDKLRKDKKLWREKNKEKANARQRIWREKNKEKDSAYKAKYKERYPHKSGEYTRQRRARKQQAIVIPYKVLDVLNIYGSNCHLCGKEINLEAPKKTGKEGWEHGLHIDHLIPISMGGSDTIDNVRPAHGWCNMSRGTKNLGEKGE